MLRWLAREFFTVLVIAAFLLAFSSLFFRAGQILGLMAASLAIFFFLCASVVEGLRVREGTATLRNKHGQNVGEDDALTGARGVESRHAPCTNARDSVSRFGGSRGGGSADPKPLHRLPPPVDDNRDPKLATGTAGVAPGRVPVKASLLSPTHRWTVDIPARLR